jgi:hypothetical protein
MGRTSKEIQRACEADCWINAEGVRQFQPRVTPWVNVMPKFATLKGLANGKAHTSNDWRTPSVFSRLNNSFPPGCYPGLELANAFGVKS